MEDLLKGIVKILKETEAKVAELKEGTSFDKPVNSDLAKTYKAMAYEDVLGKVRKYNEKRRK